MLALDCDRLLGAEAAEVFGINLGYRHNIQEEQP